MKPYVKSFYEYQFEYYLAPGVWLNEAKLNLLKNQLTSINVATGRNLTYGIFDPKLDAKEEKEFFTHANICLIKENNIAIGFFYNLVLQTTPFPIIHAGLVMLGKNSGHDLLSASYAYMTYLQYKKFGPHYYTNISSTPSIVGVFADTFTNVWPSYKANQVRPPSKDYVRVLELLEEKYIKKYFNGTLQIDKKRFVLKSNSSAMGFETDLKKLSRYSKPESNYFCMFWLDYTKGEDLIQVGRVDFKAVTKLNLFFLFQQCIGLFKRSSRPKKNKPLDHSMNPTEKKTAA